MRSRSNRVWMSAREKNAVIDHIRQDAFIWLDVCGLQRGSGVARRDSTASPIHLR